MKRFGIGLTTVALLIGAVMAYSSSAAQRESSTVLVANMNGEKEVSPEGESGVGDQDGTGKARINLQTIDSRVCFRVNWRNIASPNASHIHEGGPNEAGPVVVALFASEDPLPATLLGVRGCVEEVEPALIRRIKRNPEDFYVNVHNADFPGGAIRGQLRRPKR